MDLRLRVYDDLDTLSRAAADDMVELLAPRAQSPEPITLALSGGSTPRALYQRLAKPPYDARLPWPRLHLFWGDERCVSPQHEESSFRLANDLLLKHVPVPPENIHRVEGERDPHEAAEAYAQTLARYAANGLAWPRFDLVLLGLGDDGHTASLFPGPITSFEKRRPTLVVTADYQGRPARRVTLTPLVFNDARHILFLVAGASKAEAVRAVLKGHADPERWPASRIRPTFGTVTWLLDRAAARLLS